MASALFNLAGQAVTFFLYQQQALTEPKVKKGALLGIFRAPPCYYFLYLIRNCLANTLDTGDGSFPFP